MKSISKILVAITLLLSSTACNAQIKNAKTETVKIYGNCGMCETTIETAGNLKKVAKVDWNKDTKMATLTYNPSKTSQDEILKKIALAGYDSDKFLAPNEVYAKLPDCCHYDRAKKEMPKMEKTEIKEDHSGHNHEAKTEIKSEVKTDVKQEEKQSKNQLETVFDNYFALKDALVKTDGTTASTAAKALFGAINAVKMDKLPTNVHIVWMKVLNDLQEEAKTIANTKEVEKQRNGFIQLSKNMYALMKVSKTETPAYYQFCPMANNGKGANWLSKENTVKNPYYGSQMMSCGKTVETIK